MLGNRMCCPTTVDVVPLSGGSSPSSPSCRLQSRRSRTSPPRSELGITSMCNISSSVRLAAAAPSLPTPAPSLPTPSVCDILRARWRLYVNAGGSDTVNGSRWRRIQRGTHTFLTWWKLAVECEFVLFYGLFWTEGGGHNNKNTSIISPAIKNCLLEVYKGFFFWLIQLYRHFGEGGQWCCCIL